MKLRLGMALACVVLLAGCPDAADDMRRARGEAGDKSVVAEVVADKYVCTNVRPWREDLDLPAYLSGTMPSDDPDFEASRDRRKKEYIAAHEGTYTVCHQELVDVDVNANRGTCKVCTQMLTDPAWQEKHVNLKPGGSTYDPENPIRLDPSQMLSDKVEFRLKYLKEDYVTKADDQIASFKEWAAKRRPERIVTGYDSSKNPAEPIIETDPAKIVDIMTERAKNKGLFTKDEANPKVMPKFGLPPLAEPYIQCPKCSKPINPTESKCWNCNTYYTLSQRDERNAIAEPYETLCPFCQQPVDPTLNWCDNPSCKKFHRAIDREGPCWRCGGSHICPECLGSGKGHGPIEGGDDCWLCGGKQPGGSNGACPECDAHGFTTYDGALPAGFKAEKRAAKDWRLSAKSSGGGAAKKPIGDEAEKPEKAPKEKE